MKENRQTSTTERGPKDVTHQLAESFSILSPSNDSTDGAVRTKYLPSGTIKKEPSRVALKKEKGVAALKTARSLFSFVSFYYREITMREE